MDEKILPNLSNDKLAQARKLMDQFKYKDALEILNKILENEFEYREALGILNKIENVNELTVDEQNSFFLIQSSIFFRRGQYNKALDAVEKVLQQCIKTGDEILILKASLARGWILLRLGKTDESNISILKCNELISIIKEQPKQIIGIKRDVASAFNGMGEYYMVIYDFNKALEYYGKALKIEKEISGKNEMANIYCNMGEIYRLQGDLDHAMEYYEHSLTLGETMDNKPLIAGVLENIAFIYYEKGDLDKSLNYEKKSLMLVKEIGNNFGIVGRLFCIIPIYLDQNELASVHICLEELRKIKDFEENPFFNYRFLVAKALVLKKTGGIRNIIRAEDILIEIAEDKSVFPQFLVLVLLNLCELLYEELQITNRIVILDEIGPIIIRLLDIMEKEYSYILLAEVYLFKSKLSLINLEIDEAQRLLTKGQQITQKYKLLRLEKKISLEHDQLLEKLEIWKEFKKQNAPMSERLKLVSFEGDLNLMMRKKEIEHVEIIPEESLFLSIISKGGTSFYTHFFSKEWEDKKMFNSFMSAFNMFSNELFSMTLDRVKIGDNTIIMVPFDDKFLCYVIKGQTYPAQQKLNKFLEGIKNSKEILDAINRSFSTGLVLTNENAPDLGELVSTIFA